MRLLWVGFLALACVACSTTPAIKLVATPNPVPGDGLTKVTVTATATEGGSPSSSATVHFKTTLGTFDGATGTGELIDVTTDGNGQAVATFPAPRQGFGTITVTASVSLQGKEPSATVQVPLAPSGGLAGGISFTCISHNVGAFVFNRQTDIHMLCRATVLDTANHVIPRASVQTLSEAGSLDWLDDNQGIQEFVYTVRPDDAPPKDVMPCDPSSVGHCKEQQACPASCNGDPFGLSCQGEPCWVDSTGVTHNPRDGVATLVAAVPAVSGFDNLGEPFVDENDNGVWDPGEPYIDYNGNGKYDGPSGTQRDHMVWKEFRVIWTGEASIPPAGAGANHYSYFTQSGTTATAHFLDKNLNALAADGSSGSDGINWGANCGSGDGTFTVTDEAMDQSNPGILFIADTGAISAPGNRGTYTQHTDYANTLSSPSGTMAGQHCTVTAAPHRAYDPGAPNLPAQGSDPDNGLAGMFTF